ncbi:hypothetical protein L1987_17403 [Smallanthus sonchifolius]|uniref:Uncharacterized protein n=1 Tax=Smallanthus sonchifolius TaxID=185202 RepID=A0ACB9IXV3_9ASTR|nr:hypothetical protein L1987_17403 [Smallanthus sonchifolius]
MGFAVFLVHLATIPITGTGINPTRSLGAAIIYTKDHAWDDHTSETKQGFEVRPAPTFSIARRPESPDGPTAGSPQSGLLPPHRPTAHNCIRLQVL